MTPCLWLAWHSAGSTLSTVTMIGGWGAITALTSTQFSFNSREAGFTTKVEMQNQGTVGRSTSTEPRGQDGLPGQGVQSPQGSCLVGWMLLTWGCHFLSLLLP